MKSNSKEQAQAARLEGLVVVETNERDKILGNVTLGLDEQFKV